MTVSYRKFDFSEFKPYPDGKAFSYSFDGAGVVVKRVEWSVKINEYLIKKSVKSIAPGKIYWLIMGLHEGLVCLDDRGFLHCMRMHSVDSRQEKVLHDLLEDGMDVEQAFTLACL